MISDYPEADLIANLRHNIAATSSRFPPGARVVAEGYVWGGDAGALLGHLVASSPARADGAAAAGVTATELAQHGREGTGFDVLVLADLLFNHSEHGRLVATVRATLKREREARALVFFTPHRPWLLEKDLEFLRLAEEAGLAVSKVGEWVRERVMFEEDRGVSFFRFLFFCGRAL